MAWAARRRKLWSLEMQEIFFQTSLIAAFVGGVVALFAPCCITFLLPSYLGSVFKEKEKILLMTLIFGLGIFTTLFPAVVGVTYFSKLLFTYHDPIYYLGGIALIIVSIITLLGLKLPMPRFASNTPSRVDVPSVFIMGVFSGITSACCAPVLIGILTFAVLSPSFFGSILVGVFYVLGMITPLLMISLFLDGKVDKLTWIRKPVTTIKLFSKNYFIGFTNIISFAIFFTAGVFTIVWNFQGKLGMTQGEGFAKFIQKIFLTVSLYGGSNLALNVIFLVLVIAGVYYIIRKT